MIIAYCGIALFIAWIWVDYFRLIDVFDAERIWHFLFTFFLGALSTSIVFLVQFYFLARINFTLNGELFNDALYCVFGVGLVEELAKIIPFILSYKIFRKYINEPVDYVVFISIGALGFSAAENVLYFHHYGASVIDGRAILSTVGHMFDTSIIAYGIIKIKFNLLSSRHINLTKYVLLAAVAHGFYDFWLLHEGFKPFGWMITVLYFFVTISVFATMLNNALNHSSFFTYKKIINSDQVVKRMLAYYLIVFLAQFSIFVFKENTSYAIQNLHGSLYISGIIIVVTVVRLSRFTLVQNRWQNLQLELPFTLAYTNGPGFNMLSMRIKVKGESFNEAYVNAYFEEFCYLSPLSPSSHYLKKPRLSFIEKKIFLKNFESIYVAKLYHQDADGTFDTILLKPKTERITRFSDKHPIVAILKIEKLSDLLNTELSAENFKFREWAVIKQKVT